MKSTVYDWMKDGFTSVPNILFNQYKELDLSAEEMLFMLFIFSKLSQGESIDDIRGLSEGIGWNHELVTEILNDLTNKGFLSIELTEGSDGRKGDHYTLRPLFEKLDEINYQELPEKVSLAQSSTTGLDIVTRFEQEFGRQLTQIELETLRDWVAVSRYDEGLINLALKQAVLNQALSLKYIDRILLNWEKKNIRTPREAQQEMDRFQERHTGTSIDATTQANYDQFEIPMNYWDLN